MFSYGADLVNTPLDRVRFEIGDTLKETALLQDAEILALLTLYSNDIYKVCAECCDNLSARFAREGEIRGGTTQIAKLNVSENFARLAKKFRNKGITPASFRAPSISVSEKEKQETDDDRTQGTFYRGMMENTESTDLAN